MDIGLITFELAGHLNPMTTLGAALAGRGHRVTLLGGRASQPYAARAGLEFAPLGVSDDLDMRLTDGWLQLGRLSGIAAMRQTGRVMGMTSRMILRDAPRVVTEARLDGVIVDQFTPAGAVLAEQRGLPLVIACNALAGHHDSYAPPPPTLWRYRRDVFGWARNKLGRLLIPPLYNQFADSASTQVRPLELVFDPNRGEAQIAQQPAWFDFPRNLPGHFHYTAPWHRESRDDDIPFPWERLDGRPLIYASMGTLQNNQRHVFGAIVEAIREQDVQLVVTQGGRSDDLDLPLPDNALLVKHAPQLRLLDRAALAITHAGLNTALECMARGVPMVCLPVTNDQPGVARRVEWLGLGEILPVRQLTPSRLRARIERVLRQPGYRQTAASYRDRLKAQNGPAMASDIVERALATRQPVPAR